jgi:L-histidine Nalpha-methyltransferase
MAIGEIARTPARHVLPYVPDTREPLEWLELDRADDTARFMGLNSDLTRGFDRSGDGKRIVSGHAYTGLGAAAAWASVCRDPLCGPPSQSVESFADRWYGIHASAPPEPCHYVSLGPGDGRKDGVLLSDLSRANRDMCYLPVDASEEVLHLAVRGMIRRLGLPTDRVLSLPWDFSSRERMAALRRLLDELFGDTPVLFSLLGNTIAHFDEDTAVLGLISSILRPHDRLLLEVEVTSSLAFVPEAVREYARSAAFGEFVTSALRHHTDLPVDGEHVELLGTVEEDRALVVKTVYRAGEDGLFTLPNNATVFFARDDTVRLGLSRKYSPEGLSTMLADAGLRVVADECVSAGGPFGLALLTLEVN